MDTPRDRLGRLLDEIEEPAGLIDLSAAVPNWELSGEARAELADLAAWSLNPPACGTIGLAAALGAWLGSVFALEIGEVGAATIPTAGSKEGLASAITAVVSSGRKVGRSSVLVPDGAYHAVTGAALLAGAAVQAVEIRQGQKLSKCIAAAPQEVLEGAVAMIFPFPADPFAPPETIEDLQSVLEAADRYKFAIVADECMVELYDGVRPASFLDLAAGLGRFPDNLIVSTTLSKRSFASGLRSACLIASEPTADEILRLRRQASPAVPVPIQRASARLWTDPQRAAAIRAHLSRSRTILAETCGPSFGIAVPGFGLYAWVGVNDDCAAARRAYAAGVRTMPVSLLRHGPPAGPHVPLLRTALDGDHHALELGLERLVSALTETRCC